jgi:hypothetical protein
MKMSTTRDPLAVFIYLLADSHLPLGRIIGLARRARTIMKMGDGQTSLENPLIAQVVGDIATYLRGEGP